MIKQLQKKFVLSSMLAITVLLVVVLGGVNVVNAISTNRQSDKLLSTLGQIENSAITMMLPEVRSSWNLFSAVVTQDDTLGAIYFVAREDNHGKIRTIDTSHISSVDVKEAQNYVYKVKNNPNNSGTFGRFKYVIIPTVGNLGRTYIFLDITKQITNLWQVLLLSLAIGIICWFIMLLFVIVLSKKVIKPIASNIEKQKQFVTDAGHEIKTPLAIILANTDALELYCGETKYSKNIRNQIFRLKDLMQDLLTLAKMEESTDKKIVDHFCISDEVLQSFLQFDEIISAKGILLQNNIQTDIYMKSNKDQVQRLLSILMDNATKYTPEGGTIEVSLSQANKQINLLVVNKAQDFEKLELDKLFDRFYRGDYARTQSSGGYGIGLSAAKAIVQSLKGTIVVGREAESKIAFWIKLPLEIV